jgi:hypothetical protein
MNDATGCLGQALVDIDASGRVDPGRPACIEGVQDLQGTDRDIH